MKHKKKTQNKQSNEEDEKADSVSQKDNKQTIKPQVPVPSMT